MGAVTGTLVNTSNFLGLCSALSGGRGCWCTSGLPGRFLVMIPARRVTGDFSFSGLLPTGYLRLLLGSSFYHAFFLSSAYFEMVKRIAVKTHSLDAALGVTLQPISEPLMRSSADVHFCANI